MVLDHHAAHERVLYEKLLGGLPSEGHMLLFPQQVKLSHKEYLLVLNNKDMLMEFGMEVEDFGRDTVIVRSMPPELKEADMRSILSDAAAAMKEGEKPGQKLSDNVAASIASPELRLTTGVSSNCGVIRWFLRADANLASSSSTDWPLSYTTPAG